MGCALLAEGARWEGRRAGGHVWRGRWPFRLGALGTEPLGAGGVLPEAPRLGHSVGRERPLVTPWSLSGLSFLTARGPGDMGGSPAVCSGD